MEPISLMLNQTIKFDNHMKDINHYGHNKYPHKVGIFVINLKRRPDRLKSIEDQMRSIGIDDYHIIEAVDGYALSEEQILSEVNLSVMESVFDEVYIRRPEIGCSMSHNLIYKKVIGEDYSHAIVLEDDAIFGKDLKDFLIQALSNEIDITFDALIFGYLRQDRLKTKAINKSLGDIGLVKFEHPVENDLEIWGTHGYIVSNRGARKFLSCNDKVLFRSDNIWNIFINSFETLATEKNLVTIDLDLFGTDIDNRAAKYWDTKIY